MKGAYSVVLVGSALWAKERNIEAEPSSSSSSCAIQHTTGQDQCLQAHSVETLQPTTTLIKHSSKLVTHTCHTTPFSFTSMLLVLFLLVAFAPGLLSSLPIASESGHRPPANQTFRPGGEEVQNLKRVSSYLSKINKPAVKTIQASILISSCLCEKFMSSHCA